MSLSTEEFLSEICKKQERTISLLKYLCWVTTAIALLLFSVGADWLPVSFKTTALIHHPNHSSLPI